MRISAFLFCYLCLLWGTSTQLVNAQVRIGLGPFGKQTRARLDLLQRSREAETLRRLTDPATGQLPTHRTDAARQVLSQPNPANRQGRLANPVSWTERGPLGFTGTVQALLIQKRDSARLTAWAGTATGGLWVNANLPDTISRWFPISDMWSSRDISALVALNDSTLLAATGSLLAPTPGGGIWKSTNRGQTWARLTATIPSSASVGAAAMADTALAAAFRRIPALAVSKTGLLVAATNRGVVRSTNGGTSWQVALVPRPGVDTSRSIFPNRFAAVRVGADSLVYAATVTGRVFRSKTPAATTWTDITPPVNGTGTVAGAVRTEMALAKPLSGTGVVLYAAQIAYDSTAGGPGIRWLQRSVNSGRTWQPMPRPAYPGSTDPDITFGFADRYLSLNAHPDSAQVVYLTAYDQLYRSADGGQTWLTGQFIDRTTAFLPTPNGAVWGTEQQVYYAPKIDALTRPGFDLTRANRSAGLNGLALAGTALKNIKNDPYRLVGTQNEPGLLELNGPVSLTETAQLTYLAYPLRPFIDQNEPALEVATTQDGGFIARNKQITTGWDYYAPNWGNTPAMVSSADYDSRTNTLFFWANGYKKATGFGTETIAITPLSDTLPRPTYLKTGALPGTVYVAVVGAAVVGAKLYRITGTASATATLTRIDRGAFPVGSAISSVDVGSTDSVLVVTLANYGVASVWYTANAGTTWTNKDLPAHGLPDIPVYAALLNPTDRRQVMLGTDLGVWLSADITATNPAWTLASANLPLLPATQLSYRSADGRVSVATAGRGLWETYAWALLPPALLTGPLPATALCVGSSLPLAYTLTNAPPTPVLARLSDAFGDFTKGTMLTTGQSGTLTAVLPTTLAAGTGYRIRLDVPELGLSVPYSQTLTINTLARFVPQILDRRTALPVAVSAPVYTTGYVCPGDSALLRAYLPNWPVDSAARYRWAIDGTVLTGQQAATLLTGRTGTYSLSVLSGSCQVNSLDSFLLIAINTPIVSVLNVPNADNGPICSGTSQRLGTSYSGQKGQFQWTREGVPVAGATSPTLAATATGAYAFSLSFGQSGTGVAASCAATARPVYLTFGQSILPPTISVLNDVLPTLCGTETVGMYASPQPDSTAYQWLRYGQPVPGQTSPAISVAQEGPYTLRVRRGACSAVSSPVSVSANGRLANGFYFFGSSTVCSGETLALYAKNTAHALQWTKNNVPIPGATGPTYLADTTGLYGLAYATGGCSGTAVAVSVVQSRTLTPRLTVTEQCAAAELATPDFPHSGTVTFSWRRNGAVVAQSQQAYRTVTESGTYSVSVSNGTCGGLSAPVSLTLGKPARPVIGAQSSLVRCANSAVRLARVSGPYSFWKRNGTRLLGEPSEQLVAATAGIYSLVYQQDSCLTESNALTVTFGQPATASILNQSLVAAGQATTLTVQLTGAAPWSVSVAGGPVLTNTSQSTFTMVVVPDKTTSYSVNTLTDGCGAGLTGSIGRVFVGGADLSVRTWLDKRVCRPGETMNYWVEISNAGPDDAEDIVLVNRLPPGLSYAESMSATAADTLLMAVGAVPANQVRTLRLNTRVNRPGIFRNAVEIWACAVPDPDSRPATGTADGEDDTALADWRTVNTVGVSGTAVIDSAQVLYTSPNPNGRVLPTVIRNQPPPVANRADLSLSMFLDKRVATAGKDTVQVTLVTANLGAVSTSTVQTSLTLTNGSYSLDRRVWMSVAPTGTVISLSVGTLAANASASRSVYWIPTAAQTCRAEITRSVVPDPDSTPANRTVRPGEDDEASVDIRMR